MTVYREIFLEDSGGDMGTGPVSYLLMWGSREGNCELRHFNCELQTKQL